MPTPLLNLESIGLFQGGRWLMRGVDLNIEARDRFALIGRNGAGKTTLLNIIRGILESDEGRRSSGPNLGIGYLEQDPRLDGFSTLRDFAMAGPDAPALHEVEAIAHQIGIDLESSTQTASGGEIRRAQIARLLARDYDLLLLDEPTNHLDIAAIDWLENTLLSRPRAFIAISHDRRFLARLTDQCLWLEGGRLRCARIGFGGFEAWQEKIIKEESRAAEKLDNKLRQELHWLARGVTARRKRNQGRLERLNLMRQQRRAMLGQMGVAKLQLAEEEAKSRIAIDVKEISKSFAGRKIIKDLSIRIQKGERLGIVGPNGAGKTTLVRLLTGEMSPDQGEVVRAPGLVGATIDQQRHLLQADKSVRDVLTGGGDWIMVGDHKKRIEGYLKEFLFDPEIADSKVGLLSGGERARILLMREFARKSNLLVLDEPTNDLDLETLDLLQETIADYDGTVILVSHDRDFLDRTATMTIFVDGTGKADIIAGGYSDWKGLTKDKSNTPPRKGKNAPADTPIRKTPANKLSYKDQRELDLLPETIAQLEKDIQATQASLDDPDLYAKDPDAFARKAAKLEKLRTDLEEAENRWLELGERAEDITRAIEEND